MKRTEKYIYAVVVIELKDDNGDLVHSASIEKIHEGCDTSDLFDAERIYGNKIYRLFLFSTNNDAERCAENYR